MDVVDVLDKPVLTAAKQVILYQNSDKGFVVAGWYNPGYKVGVPTGSLVMNVAGRPTTFIQVDSYGRTFYVVFDGKAFVETGGKPVQPSGSSGAGAGTVNTEASNGGGLLGLWDMPLWLKKALDSLGLHSLIEVLQRYGKVAGLAIALLLIVKYSKSKK